MDDKSTLALTLAQADLERIIQQTITAQVAAAFAAKGGAITTNVVQRMLTETVDSNGKPCHYSKTTMIEQLCYGQLREQMREIVVQWVKDNEEQLRKAVVAQLNKSRNKVAAALMTSLIEAAASQYRFSVSVLAEMPKSD